MGIGYAKCSANMLMNHPEGSYSEIFRTVSAMISRKKLHRYDAEKLRMLNLDQTKDHTRECRVCHRSDRLTEGDKCSFCAAIESMSAQLLKKSFFVVSKGRTEKGLSLPFDCSMRIMNRENVIDEMKKPDYV